MSNPDNPRVNVEVSDRVDVAGDDYDSTRDVTVEVSMGDDAPEQEVLDHNQSYHNLLPKILKANKSGAPVVPPEVVTHHAEEEKKNEQSAEPANVLREMEVQTGH